MTHEQALSLGRMLRQRREALGLSTRALQAKSGVDDTAIVRLENGFFKRPPPEKLAAVAEALELPVEDILARAQATVPQVLPSFRPYLRAKYPGMPAAAEAELEEYFTGLAEKYGFQPEGPAPGEDEDEP